MPKKPMKKKAKLGKKAKKLNPENMFKSPHVKHPKGNPIH